MARPKTLNMDKMKVTLKKTECDLKDWKTRIRQAVDSGEHKTAEAAIKLLTKSRDGLHKMLEQVEAHATKKKPKAESTTTAN
jgi:hypothetical protein